MLLQWSRMGETESAGRIKVFMCPTLPLLINEVRERSRRVRIERERMKRVFAHRHRRDAKIAFFAECCTME